MVKTIEECDQLIAGAVNKGRIALSIADTGVKGSIYAAMALGLFMIGSYVASCFGDHYQNVANKYRREKAKLRNN